MLNALETLPGLILTTTLKVGTTVIILQMRKWRFREVKTFILVNPWEKKQSMDWNLYD